MLPDAFLYQPETHSAAATCPHRHPTPGKIVCSGDESKAKPVETHTT
ncbi:hypothetical protein HMPREF0742_02021 [Rothia aeria F0184]|uniref:Uncharacterized protein n=1 Tax=Rothia aeria F0184 TaxID=888019 RepID=U7V3M5_9MICC|nr:hypothetical protein HMPREF0742_02021 [Rothia aeria F0184]